MDKTIIRNTVKHKLHAMSEVEYARKSSMIHNKVINLQEIKDAKIIALTISNFPEVDTKKLIEALWKMDKKIAIPKCTSSTREMHFYVFTNYEQLEQVYMELLEPKIGETTLISKDEIDVLISPGIVFDKQGFRIGYGGGYYDRFLVDYKKITLSMAFEVQLVEKVPVSEYDLPICTIITEEQIIKCNEV